MACMSTKIPLSSFILLTLCLVQIIHVFAALEPYEVHIVNNLPDNTAPLFIHCKSKNNDLGPHNLLVNNDFNWNFRMNVWESTLYTCDFSWTTKNIGFVVFDASVAYSECGNKLTTNICYWSVQQDGFYLANVLIPPPSSLKKMRSW